MTKFSLTIDFAKIELFPIDGQVVLQLVLRLVLWRGRRRRTVIIILIIVLLGRRAIFRNLMRGRLPMLLL